MRGVWENEKSLSPALLRSALGTVGVFLALTTVVMLIMAAGAAYNHQWAAAGWLLAVGIALPFGIWLGLRILADMLAVLHRSQERLEMIVQLAGGQTPVAADPVFTANGAASGRAGDDGPAYPNED